MSNPTISRRSFLLTTSTAFSGLFLRGCQSPQPSIFTPVLSGFSDHTAANGIVRVWFPSLHNPSTNTLYIDAAPYPLILFCHGNGSSYQSWDTVGWELARCGFIVAIPKLSEAAAGDPAAIQTATNALSWLRTSSPYASLLNSSLGIGGHSLGGTIAAALAATTSPVALATIASPLGDVQPMLPFPTLPPALFIVGDQQNDAIGSDFAIQQNPGLWNLVRPPKHSIQFAGALHFDYVAPSAPGIDLTMRRGPCTLLPSLTADILCAFFSKYMGQPGVQPGKIWDTLLPVGIPVPDPGNVFQADFLTASQKYYRALPPEENCRAIFTWVTTGGEGTITLH